MNQQSRVTDKEDLSKRMQVWREGSLNLTYISISLESQAYGLGRFECELTHNERLYLDTQDETGGSTDWQIAVFDHRIQSYLWLLGAYELVRTLAQKLREVPDLGTDDLRAKIAHVKNTLARPRMLTAKHEAMRNASNSDKTMSCLNMVFLQPKGVYFLSSPGVLDISRQDLAAHVIDLLYAWPSELSGRAKKYPLGYLYRT